MKKSILVITLLMGLAINANASALKKAKADCESGNGEACYKVANMYIEGTSEVKQDGIKVVYFYVQSCDNNYTMGCSDLADIYSYAGEMGTKEAYTQSLMYYKKACSLGSGEACFNVNIQLRAGLGAKQDYNASTQYVIKACEDGFNTGCYSVGMRYLNGQGIKKNNEKASEYFQRSCDGGYGNGCHNLAYLHHTGNGTKWNGVKIASYYEKACGLEIVKACGSLGMLYQDGANGLKKNEEMSKKFYKKACLKSDKNTEMGQAYCKLAE